MGSSGFHNRDVRHRRDASRQRLVRGAGQLRRVNASAFADFVRQCEAESSATRANLSHRLSLTHPREVGQTLGLSVLSPGEERAKSHEQHCRRADEPDADYSNRYSPGRHDRFLSIKQTRNPRRTL